MITDKGRPSALFAGPLIAACLLTWAMAVPGRVDAQEAARPGIEFSGGVQVRASAGLSASREQDRLGFGMRRARLRMDAALRSRSGVFLQLDGSGGTVTALDFFAYLHPAPGLRIRAGRMAGAQPRGLILTSMAQIDATDRAAVAEYWARRTIGADGRDFGVDARLEHGPAEVMLFVHSGDGSWDRARGNFRESISGGDATAGVHRTALAVSGALRLRPSAVPGLVFGGFAGYNPTRPPQSQLNGFGRRYATYGLHAYYGENPGSQRIRVKADFLAVTYEAVRGAASQNTAGVALLAAARVVRGVEVLVRGEALELDTFGDDDAEGFFTAGVTFSPSARRGEAFHAERLTLAWNRYKAGVRDARPEDLIILQLQLIF